MWLLGLAVVVAVFLVVEGSLRLFLGLGDRLLYIPDREMGYLLAPNQHLRRLGKQIAINQYSMRSPDLSATRPAATLRILLLGDSIANGAWWTDQQETISALMEQQLRGRFPAVEVLNASANSWGPRNQVAYLRRFGTFESQAIVLLLNTDDLFATAPTSLPVGRDRNYPNRQPLLALTEVFERFFPPQAILEMAALNAEKGDRVGFNLAAIAEIKQRAAAAQAQLFLALTPLLREVESPTPREYEQKARLRLQHFAEDEQIPYLDFLPRFQHWHSPASLYRDHIHLSPQGNQLVSSAIAQALEDLKFIGLPAQVREQGTQNREQKEE